MLTILNIILATLSLSVGLWWFCRIRQERTLSFKSSIFYLLLAIFTSYNSLMCTLGDVQASSACYVIADVVEDFFSLLIMPVIYNIVADITMSNVSRGRLCLTFLPAIVVGIINVVPHVVCVSQFVGLVNTYLFNITIFLQLLFFVYAIIGIFYAYRNKIYSYYVDIQTTDFNKVHGIVVFFFLVTFITYVQLIFQRSPFDGNHVILLFSSLCIAIVICVVGWNMSRIDGDTVVIDISRKPYTPAEVMEMTEKIGRESVATEKVSDVTVRNENPSSQVIDDIISSWAQRPDKPYLREGISLAMAAEEMGLTVRIVSFYLNTVLKINFNAWINSLRIGEVVRLLNKRTTLPLSVIALKCGFADTPMLSKNFKKITGMTITEYKKKNNLV